MKRIILLFTPTILLTLFLLSCSEDNNYYHENSGEQNGIQLQELIDQGYTTLNITFTGTAYYYKNVSEFKISKQFLEFSTPNTSGPPDIINHIADLNKLQRIMYQNKPYISLYF